MNVFLGLRNCEPSLAQDPTLSDVVLVSLDLEVACCRKYVASSSGKAPITEIGFAILDTRYLYSKPIDITTAITARFFRVSDIIPCSKKAERKRKRPCVFTNQKKITQSQIASTIVKNLQIRDKSRNGALRNIALIGHSIKEDRKVLQFLGLTVFDIASISVVIDTHLMASYILPLYIPDLPLGQRFPLVAVLQLLSCSPGPLNSITLATMLPILYMQCYCLLSRTRQTAYPS